MTITLEKMDELAKDIGFGSAKDFLYYVISHSDTPRAIFFGKQIGALLIMNDAQEAGEKWMNSPDAFKSVDLSKIAENVLEKIKDLKYEKVDRTELGRLLEAAKNHVMTPREKWLQQVSGVYGLLPHDSPTTRDQVERYITEEHGPCPEE